MPSNPHDRRRAPRRTPAFTLLELVIVLLVMVGMLAVVWPNLQRPLRRTTLDEAAQMLRDAIDENRYQAMLLGQPRFIHLQQGSSELLAGTFAGFTASSSGGLPLADSSQGESASPRNAAGATAGPTSPAAVRSWQLPATVVVSQVRWTLDILLSPEEDPGTPAGATDSSPAGTDSLLSDGESTLASLASSGQSWWLPLTASGQGRDATIELFDTSIEETLTVTYAAATGALEIRR
ncbi:MAG: hypothetical protein KDA45_01575 [Planctomycetales bacterium]|nr:hypothetical protein [Planctomycetales bacterium]